MSKLAIGPSRRTRRRLVTLPSGVTRTQELSDDFNRANGALGANWENVGAWTVTSNTARKASATSVGTVHVTAVSADNHYATAKVAATWTESGSASPYGGLIVRGNAAFTEFMIGGFRRAASAWTLAFTPENSGTVLASVAASAPVANDVLLVETIGTVLNLYLNGVLMLTHTTSTYNDSSHRKVGMYGATSSTSTVQFDDWAAGIVS